MSNLVISGDTSGTIMISAPAVAGNNVLTLPAITDTLLTRNSTDTSVINFGAGQFYKDASGSVGIGTTSPSNVLGVKSSTQYKGIAINNGTNDIAQLIGQNTGNDNGRLILFNGGAAGVAIIASGDSYINGGNLGIGSTSPVSKLDVNGSIRDSFGNVRDIPQNSQSSAYTLIATDSGKHISTTTGGVTVPASVFNIGNSIVVFNNSASSQTVTQGANVTMYLSGTANTGNRTLAQRGLATIICVSSNTFVISGSVT